jgi:hypothetical protein
MIIMTVGWILDAPLPRGMTTSKRLNYSVGSGPL